MSEARRAVTVRTVSKFVIEIEKIKSQQQANKNRADLLFRGQACDKPLLPKLGRISTRGRLENIEKLIFDEFKRLSPPTREFEPQDDWDYLALAQHHGLPTRLLDWTYNALAALWFTVRHAPERKSPENGVVWVLCARTKDFRLKTSGTSPLANTSRTLVFRPKAIARRIVAQSGAFTVHKILDGKRFVPLETHRVYKDKLFKLVVPPAAFPTIRQELNRLGTNASLLLPDLDGLCAHLLWRYAKLSDE